MKGPEQARRVGRILMLVQCILTQAPLLDAASKVAMLQLLLKGH